MDTELTERDTETSQPHDVFVSYARQDQAFVRRLTDALAERGKRAWVDWVDIPPTAEWMAEIRAAIDAADTYVVVLSPASIASKVCAAELDSALSANKRIVPVVAVTVEDDEVPSDVAKLNWVSFTEGFDPALEKLLVALDTDLDHVKAHTRLQVRAREWDAKGEDKALLFRGRELSESEAWLSTTGSKEPHPTALQTRFLLASRRSATRRQRGAITGVTAMFLVAALFAGIAVQQRNSAVEQRHLADQRGAVAYSRQLAVESSVQVEHDPELGLLLAIESSKAAPTVEAQDALAHALRSASLRQELPVGSPADDAMVSPDGSQVLTFGYGAGKNWDRGLAKLWDLKTGALVASIMVDGDQVFGGFSTAGDAIELGTTSGPAAAYSTLDGSRLPTLPTSLVWSATSVFSPAGDRYVTNRNGEVALWDASTGAEVARVPGRLMASQRTDFITQGAFSSDGARLAVVDASRGTVGIYASADGRLERRLRVGLPSKPGRFYGGVSFTTDGSSVVISAANLDTIGDARVWSLSTGRPTASLGPGTWPPFAIGQDEIAASTQGSRIELLDPTTGRRRTMGALSGTTDSGLVDGLAIDPSGTLLAVVDGRSGDLRVWNIRDGSLVQTTHAFQSEAAGVRFTPDGRSVVTWGSDGNNQWFVRVFDVLGSIPIASLSGADHANFDGVGGGTTFRALVPQPGGLAVIDGTGRVLRTLAGTGVPATRSALSPDATRAIVGYEDGSVRIFDTATGAVVASLAHQSKGVGGVAIAAPDLALTYDGTGTARTWNAATGTLLATMPASNPSMPPRFVAGGRLVALGAWAGDGSAHDPRVVLADARTGTVAFTYHDRDLTQFFDVDPQGRWAAVLGNDSKHPQVESVILRLFSVPGGRQVLTNKGGVLPSTFAQGAALSPDGRWLAAGDDLMVAGHQQDDAVLWDTTTGKTAAVLAGHEGGVEAVAFSPDGRLLASGADDQTVRLWRIPSGQPARVLRGFAGVPQHLAFSPDGSLLLIADGLDVSLWRVATGALLSRFQSDADGVAFSADGTHLLLARAAIGISGFGSPRGLRILPCDVCGSQPDLLALAEARAYRSLTADERQTYLSG